MCVLCLLLQTSIQGQDAHFSQFNFTPLQVNPANAGDFNGCYRIHSTYRNQWNSVTTPYTTYLISFDEPIRTKSYSENKFGIGVILMNDQFSTKGFNHFMANIALSAHRYVDHDKDHKISGSLQLGFAQKSLNISDFSFLSQYDKDQSFDLSLPNGEPISSTSIFYPDVGIGTIYHYNAPSTIKFKFGVAIHHLFRPKEQFLNQGEHRINRRYNISGKLIYPLEEKIDIRPSILYMKQGSSNSVVIGSDFLYRFFMEDNLKRIGHLGLWYRSGDALIVAGGFNYNGHLMAIAYDLNISSLSNVSGYNGGFEITYRHLLKCFPRIPVDFTIPCIRL